MNDKYIPFPRLLRNGLMHADTPLQERAQIVESIFGG